MTEFSHTSFRCQECNLFVPDGLARMAAMHSHDRNNNATEVFRKDFKGYQKITGSDYLEHSLLFGVLESILKDKKKALRILDIGCGDAGNISKVLSSEPTLVASYTGVDMSETAIEDANNSLREALGSDVPIFFHISDMLSYLQNVRSAFDVIIAAFAIHHLTSEDKQKALKEIRRCLTPNGGTFIMVDPFRQKGETLEAYRKRASEVGETWVSMGPEAQAKFIKHMQDYDVMEEQSFFERASKESGFANIEVLCRGQKGLQSCVTALRA